jgi:M3 family oligoendopeptidase
LLNEFDTAAILANIRFSIDTNDEFYANERTWWDNTSPELSLLSEKYYKIIVKSPFRQGLEMEFGEQLFTIADFKIIKIDERIVEDRKLENKLRSQYYKLLASAKIDWNGQELNLSQLAPYKVSSDSAIRKKAADASFNFLSDNSETLDKIFDELTRLRHGMAKKIGLNNFVELGYIQMTRTDYTPEMVAKYRKKILDYIVPLVERLKKRQANRIGLDSLKHFDEGFKFKTGNPTPKGDAAWLIEKGREIFKELSPETDEFYSFMTKYALMDLDTKKGKKTGAYCTFLPSYSAPFIFSNSNGTSDDIRVLIHEAGHCFQKYQSAHFKVSEYFWPTKESAEIHAMSMELFAMHWMELFFGKDTEKFKFQHISKTLEFLPYGAAVDEFQHKVYEEPTMTPEERKAVWRSIEMKYKPSLDYDGNEFAEAGGRWQQQAHIYEMPFYYIDYTIAQVCALQFWVRMQNDFEGAWEDYLKLCKAGGSMSFLKLVELAGLKSPFEDGVVEEVAAAVEVYLDAIDDSNF